jgi:ferredoxin-NADP reductase
MVDILARIPNPLTRSATSALMGASAATILTGGLLGLTAMADRTVYRLGTYAALVGAAAGAVAGAALGGGTVTPKAPPGDAIASPPVPQAQGSGDWTDWRNFRVVRRVAESQEITSFYLQPEDGQSIPGFVPGQFLTIKLNIPDQPRPVIRTYSLSDYAEQPDYYRLSIKREGSPRGQDVPPGLASNFMHDQIQVGAVIPCKPPAGKFVLDVHRHRPAVLISNGVGITPMISMAKAVTAQHPERPVWFLHGARDGSFHAFREAVLAIAPEQPDFTVHYRYSRPRPEDQGAFHSTGYVDTDLVKSLLAPRFAPHQPEIFLCGSPSFMDSLRQGLAEWGVPASQVYFESFAKPRATATPAAAPPTAGPETAEVVFARSGKTATWTASDGPLLDFAEAQGLSPDFSCRAGICLTCMCRLEAGEVAYDAPPPGTPDAGHALICVSKPRTAKVVLDI